MKKLFFFAAAASVMLAACSSDNEEATVAEKSAIRLSTQSLTGMTRAGQSVQLVQFAADENVGIFLAEDNAGSPVTSGTNVTTYAQPLTYVADGAGNLANTQYWPQDGNGLHIFGVYPLAAATAAAAYSATGVEFSVKADQSTNSDPTIGDANYKASDLMTGLPTLPLVNPVARTTANVPMTFTHLLTKVDVNLYAGDGFTDAQMADAVVSILGTKPTTTFSVQSTDVTEATGTAATIVAGKGTAGIDVNTKTYYGTSAIIVPQEVAAGNFIQVAVGGGNYIYKLGAATTFDSKKCYTFNITVNKTGLVLTTTQITAWEDGGAANGNATLQ